MTAEKKPVSSLKKIGSVVLLLMGTVVLHLIYLANSKVVMGPGEGRGFSLFLVLFLGGVIGCGLILGGAALWERWRWALGVIFLADGLYSIAHAYGARYLAAKKTSAEAAHYFAYANVDALLGVTLLLLGGALVFYEKYRSK